MVALLWILLSDRLLAKIVGSADRLTSLQSVKGAIYVVVTAALLYLLISRGVSQLQKVIAAEREQHALLRGLVGGTPDAVCILGLDGRFLLVNRAAQILMGRDASEIVGRTSEQIFDPPLAASLSEAAAVARESGEPRTIEIGARLGEEDKRILISFSPYRDDAGHIAGTVGIAHDVTEQREREEEARRSEARLKLFVERVPAVVWTVDMDLRVTSITGAALPAMSRDESEFIGRPLTSLLNDPESKDQAIDAHRRALDGHSMSYDYVEDGVSFDCRVEPVRSTSGEVNGAIGIAFDITNRVRADRLLRQKEALVREAQKQEIVGRLAGGLAHGFNNLLTVITSSAELISASMPQLDPRRNDLDEIRHASERAAALVRELLALSSQQFLQPNVIDLHDLLIESRDILAMEAGADVAVILESSPGKYIVHADRHQLEQVLRNLASNAGEAMPDGGTLRISLSSADLNGPASRAQTGLPVKPGPYVRLEVSDNGHGMNPDVRQRIFEPFFTTRGDSAGRGLGLAVVYGIVAQSGGYVDVESKPGEGSTIVIFLPRSARVEVAVSVPGDAAPVQSGAIVLLAEDEDAVRRLARRILEREGFSVIESRDGAEALELVERAGARVDLVLSDVVMPRMGGRELVERCLAKFPDARAVLMSGYTDDALVRGDAIGDRASFLPKPFTPQALVLKVREALDAVR